MIHAEKTSCVYEEIFWGDAFTSKRMPKIARRHRTESLSDPSEEIDCLTT